MNEAINQVEVVRQEVIPIPDQAKMIVVRDEASLRLANDFFLTIRALRKRIATTFDPMEEGAKKAKREAENSRLTIVAERATIEAPLIVAEKYLGGQVMDYKREQDRIRAEEEEKNRLGAIKIEAERRQMEEDERLAQAAILEASGAKEEAEALITEAIEEKEKPLEVYIPPSATPKVELNGMAMVTTWHAEVVNPKELFLAIGQGRCPLAYGDPNIPALNKQAISLKGEMRIPGCKAVPETKPRATGRK